jgi:hypothetical protein
MTEKEFYARTPKQLNALLKRQKVETVSSEFLFAQVTAALYNTGFKSPEKQVNAVDLMPSQWGKKQQPKAGGPPIELSDDGRQELSSSLNGMLMALATKAEAYR